MNFNCQSLNVLFCIDGLQSIDVDDTPIYSNTGWGKTGWNHTDAAKKAISEANTKYTPEEKINAKKESNNRRRTKWMQKNPEKKKQYDLAYNEKNREKRKEYARLYYQRKKNK